MHIKRKTAPKTWALKKREGAYVRVGRGKNLHYSVPVVVLLRDILKIAKTEREVRGLLRRKQVKINGKEIQKPFFSVGLLDIIELPKTGKTYALVLNEKGKLGVEEKRKELIAKVIGKTILKGDRQQINFFNGINLLSKEKINTGDSAILEKGKIVKILPVKEGSIAMVIKGKHAGERGGVTKVEKREITIKIKEGEIKTDKKNIFVIG